MAKRILIITLFTVFISNLRTEANPVTNVYSDGLSNNFVKYSLISPEIIINYDLYSNSPIKITVIHESCRYMRTFNLGDKKAAHHEFILWKDRLPIGDYTYIIEAGEEVRSGSFVVSGVVAPAKLVYLPAPFVDFENGLVEINLDLRNPTMVKLVLFHQDGSYMDVLMEKQMNRGKFSIDLKLNDLPKGCYTYILETDFGINSHSFMI